MPLPPRYRRLVGSKFTSSQPQQGWRQFHVVGLRRRGPDYEAELQASCADDVRLTVAAQVLFDRAEWTPGWKSLAELKGG